ncbi:hypothetical protein BC835DRAFT_1276026, partial [Cytidiella melzeri]
MSTPNVKHGSEEGEVYVRSCRSLLNAIPLEYESPQHVEAVGNMIGTHLENLWQQYATLPKATRHSKSWWSPECSNIVKQVHDLRLHRKELVAERKRWQARVVREGEGFDLSRHQEVVQTTQCIVSVTGQIDRATRRMKGAVSGAKRSFFDGVIAKTNKLRIWDFVDWKKPRKMATTTGLVDLEGKPIDEPEKVSATFQEQFTPLNPRQVDASILDEIPQQEERAFPPFSKAELREALAKMSNFSAPGPDHASWFW